MGTFSVPIAIGDPQGENWIEMDALVDTGASVTSVPASILRELGVAPVSSQQFRFAQGEIRQMEMGRAWISVDGREEMTLFVFNDEGTPPLLGALALETLFLGFDPVAQRLIPVEGLMMSPYQLD
jgi:clan AA aspartic protease